MSGEAFYEKRFQIPHNRPGDLTPAARELKVILDMIRWLLVRDRTLCDFYSPPRTIGVDLSLELSVWDELNDGMSSSELEQLIRDFLEAKFGVTLDYFVIEGRMSADVNGNMGVTGTYRKGVGDKNVFFTVTVNLTSRKIQNLQEY